jgi:MULE transposase domain
MDNLHSSFSGEVVLGARPVAEGDTYLCTLETFKEKLLLAACSAGFQVILPTSMKTSKDGKTRMMYFACSKGLLRRSTAESSGASALESSSASVGNGKTQKEKKKRKRGGKRRAPARPRASGRALRDEDRCPWKLNASETIGIDGTPLVEVTALNACEHNHPWIDRDLLPAKLTDVHKARVRSLFPVLSASAITALLQDELESLAGQGPGVVLRRYISYLVKGDSEKSSATALQSLARDDNNIGVLQVRDVESGLLHTLELDYDRIKQLPKFAQSSTEAEQRADRREDRAAARTTPEEFEAALSKFAELRRLYHAKVKGSGGISEAQHAAIRSESHATSEVPISTGSGNHGADLSDDWSQFLYDGDLVELVAVVWVNVNTRDFVRRHPEVVMFDCTYLTNNRRLPLFDGVALDGDGRNHIMVRAFVVNERQEVFKFLFGEAIPLLYGVDFCQSIQLALIDGDDNEYNALMFCIRCGIYANMVIRLCLFHLITLRFSKIGSGKAGTPLHNAKQDIVALLWTASEAQSEDEARALITLADGILSSLTDERTFVTRIREALVSLELNFSRWTGPFFVAVRTLLQRTTSRRKYFPHLLVVETDRLLA